MVINSSFLFKSMNTLTYINKSYQMIRYLSTTKTNQNSFSSYILLTFRANLSTCSFLLFSHMKNPSSCVTALRILWPDVLRAFSMVTNSASLLIILFSWPTSIVSPSRSNFKSEKKWNINFKTLYDRNDVRMYRRIITVSHMYNSIIACNFKCVDSPWCYLSHNNYAIYTNKYVINNVLYTQINM